MSSYSKNADAIAKLTPEQYHVTQQSGARAMARGDPDAPRIAVLLVFDGAQTGRRRRRAPHARAGKQRRETSAMLRLSCA
jgi:hypothetical protein